MKRLANIRIHIYNVNMRYEWDENKNKVNKQKHDGIGFENDLR